MDELKAHVLSGAVQLYTSRLGYVEHQEPPKEFLARYKAAWTAFRENKTDETIAAVHAVDTERRAIDDAKEKEWSYWNDTPFDHPGSTFEAIITLSILGEEAVLAVDSKGELKLLADLHYTYNIEPDDAQHLMIAHSANIDVFLTWDKRLIKRAAKVPWLHPRVETPDAFLGQSQP